MAVAIDWVVAHNVGEGFGGPHSGFGALFSALMLLAVRETENISSLFSEYCSRRGKSKGSVGQSWEKQPIASWFQQDA